MSGPLAGKTVALAEGRQLEELAAMLEKEGATALRCPMVSILDGPDQAAVTAWLRELAAGRFSHVVVMTGEAWRRLMDAADRAGIRDGVVSAAARACLVTRGPKPVRALKDFGLAPAISAPVPTTEGVIDALRGQELKGRTVGLTLYGVDNPPLVQFLTDAGATVRTVLPYVYAPAADAERIADLIKRMAAGEVSAVLFTSSPQVDRLYDVAAERGLGNDLSGGLARTQVAAVGPVVAEALRRRGARVDLCPEQGFVMKNLVNLLKRHLAGPEKS